MAIEYEAERMEDDQVRVCAKGKRVSVVLQKDEEGRYRPAYALNGPTRVMPLPSCFKLVKEGYAAILHLEAQERGCLAVDHGEIDCMLRPPPERCANCKEATRCVPSLT